MKKNILVVEDDDSLAKGIKLAVGNQDINIYIANTLKKAKECFNDLTIDLIILDINLPDGNGLDFLKYVKENSNCKVIMLTANDLEVDIVTGLELGADDYMTKPFSLMILRARIKAQLRATISSNKFSVGDLELDFDTMHFTKNNIAIELSKTEQKLLKLLIENKGQQLTRGQLVDRIWSGEAEYVDENALSVCVKRLRDKLESPADGNKYIKTIYGIGYMWVVKQ